MLDIHSHILPGVDDGARTQEEALKMLSIASSIGVDLLVATPHVRNRDTDFKRITNAYDWLHPHAKKMGIHLKLGFEVYYRVLLEADSDMLRSLCIKDTDVLLLELSNDQLFPQWEYVLSDLVQKGYEPVIVHPERYVYIQEHPEIIVQMKRYGCKIQLDVRAFSKFVFSRERSTARKLLSKGWVDYIASDAHRPKDYMQMQRNLRKMKKRIDNVSVNQPFSNSFT